MKLRRLAALLAATSVVVAVAISGASALGTHGGCLLKGTASFSPGLKALAKSQNYTFGGTFAACQGVSGITSGSVSASGSGSLGCGNGSSSGTANVTWSNGSTSTISFTTTSATAVTEVKGTVTSGTFAGLPAKAVIAFSTSTPQDCATTGLPSANFNGPAEIGS